MLLLLGKVSISQQILYFLRLLDDLLVVLCKAYLTVAVKFRNPGVYPGFLERGGGDRFNIRY